MDLVVFCVRSLVGRKERDLSYEKWMKDFDSLSSSLLSIKLHAKTVMEGKSRKREFLSYKSPHLPTLYLLMLRRKM